MEKPKNQRKPTKISRFKVRDNAFFLIYSNSLQEVNTKGLKKKNQKKKIHTVVCTIHDIT